MLLLKSIRKKKQIKNHDNNETDKTKKHTTFKVSENIQMYQVSFKNQYKMTVVGHLFIPENLDQHKKHVAIKSLFYNQFMSFRKLAFI
ncbi:hypothetical protein [Pedobacter cryoconitis]|uniref:Uncharacterized protein n=1 Tax=Pedobacter cryoconitis TaxID=188932 RepID=A0A7X0MH51_9SPHI|nr:hypothetical protein [Pedobacter cryoconitis]MBB6499037.1 hypothetical protein [Pedobacter cryoconitis]